MDPPGPDCLQQYAPHADDAGDQKDPELGLEFLKESASSLNGKTWVLGKHRDHMIVFACLMKMTASNVHLQDGTSFAHLDFTISVKLFWNDFTFSERIILSGSLLYTSTMANNERLNMPWRYLHLSQ